MKYRYTSFKVAVIGDVMHDIWWDMESIKISPEAPVLDIVNPWVSHSSPGGAGNVALNVSSLGASCDLYFVGGIKCNDTRRVKEDLGFADIGVFVTEQRGYYIPSKQRFVYNGNQIVRVSKEEKPLPGKALASATRLVENKDLYDAVIISDYNKGSMTIEAIRMIMGNFNTVIVDPKHDNWEAYKGATIFKPNRNEYQTALKRNPGISPYDLFDHTVITQGEDGMKVESGGMIDSFPAHDGSVADVAGAGDTAVAILTLEYLRNGGLIFKAAKLANYGCSLSVKHRGTYRVRAEELNNGYESL